MHTSGILKQLKSGKYILELSSGWSAIKGNVKLMLNANTVISSTVFRLKGRNILFLTYHVIREMNLLLNDVVDIELINKGEAEKENQSRLPLTVMY